MLERLDSSWCWLALPGDPPLGLPLPPDPLGRSWAAPLLRWNEAGRPWPAGEAESAILRRALDALLAERYLGPPSPISSLPLPTRLLPGALRLVLHRWLVRHDAANPPGPRWPCDETADHLRSLLSGCSPHAGFRFCLSHDLDTPASFPIARRIARVEAELGHRATYFIVGRDLRRAAPLVAWLRELGHEIGLHGLRHDLRLSHLRGPALARRTARLARVARDHSIAGFRSPALLSSPELRRRLAGSFAYDSSLPSSDRRTLLGPARGCSTVEPYLLDGLLQVPISAPLEDRLLLLGYTTEGIFALYRELLAEARTRGRLLVVGFHLEPHLGGAPELRAGLERFLAETAQTPSQTIGTLATSARDRSGCTWYAAR